MTTEPWSVGRISAWATEDFRKRGLDTPRLDAELLLSHVLGLDRIRLLVEAERLLTTDELGRYRELIQRRRRAEPVAYLLGVREFYGLSLRVDRRVLVPRPDTETLVEVALERTRGAHLYGEALDLCTGSGCVALAFASRRPTWRIVASDVSDDAVVVARHNVERSGALGTVRVLRSDLDAALPAHARFDLITANPPYIPTADIETLMADVRDHEPRLALDGGPSGLALVERVVKVAQHRLSPGGIVALEVGHDQAARVAALLEAQGFTGVERRKDYGGIERVVSARATPGPG